MVWMNAHNFYPYSFKSLYQHKPSVLLTLTPLSFHSHTPSLSLSLSPVHLSLSFLSPSHFSLPLILTLPPSLCLSFSCSSLPPLPLISLSPFILTLPVFLLSIPPLSLSCPSFPLFLFMFSSYVQRCDFLLVVNISM